METFSRESILDMVGAGRGSSEGVFVPLVFVDWLGSYTTAAIMNQILFWRDVKRRAGVVNGEFYKSYGDWRAELRLTEREVRNGLDAVRKVGVRTKARRAPNGDRVLYYSVDADTFLNALQAFLTGRSVQNVRTETHAASERGSYKTYERSNTEITTENTTERENSALGIAGTFEDGKLYTALSDMSSGATGDISRNSLPCADPGEVTVRLETQIPGPDGRGVVGAVDSFDSLPSARPGIVNGRPTGRGIKQAPPPTRHASFKPTVAAILAGYPQRDGAGPTEAEVISALALIDPSHYGAIVASLPVYSRCKDVREGVVRNIATYLDKQRWMKYQPKAAPVVSKAPSAVDEIARRRAARARKEQA